MYRAFLILLLILIPRTAYADGILLIPVLTLPGMIMALIPVIAIEAGIYTRLLKLPLSPSIRLSTIANLASTFVGNFIFLLMTPFASLMADKIRDREAMIITTTYFFIFLFVVTVLTEFVAARMMSMLKTYKSKYIFIAVFFANLASYAIIVFAIIFYNILEMHYDASH